MREEDEFDQMINCSLLGEKNSKNDLDERKREVSDYCYDCCYCGEEVVMESDDVADGPQDASEHT